MYYLIILADILFAVDFSLQKLYQKKAGVGVYPGLWFNMVTGLLTSLIFLAINKFEIQFSWYSLLMASIVAVLNLLYIVIGFMILKQGNMSYYTLFLMTGGMVVPYMWGVAFLDEKISVLRFAGLIIIILSVIISDLKREEKKKTGIWMCIAVFFLNGFVSVFSKIHQINNVYETVDTTGFVFLNSLSRAVICLLLLIILKKTRNNNYEMEKKTLPVCIMSAFACGFAGFFNLSGAVSVPATVLYPLVTGGTVILSSLAGVFFFKERPSLKQWIGSTMCLIGTCMFL